ncbi:MAG: type II toxin-antitoxin system PemK/MazF family toxin [Acidobacteria bacterium]|nr:type II toxin-antitoxin system PemK/MazF family toxin [Acidobacteriota bacterium]
MLDEELIEKIRSLPPERISEVEDFVDFIAQRDQRGSKKRPAVVISSAAYNAGRLDLILMAITSQIKTPGRSAKGLTRRRAG